MTAISRSCLGRLLAEVSASPGREVCGLLLGSDERIETAIAAPNVSPHPERMFEIDPATLIATQRAAREGGSRVVGHYHSHPSGSARPSLDDEAAAEPDRLWLILTAREARLWRSGVDGFVEVPLTIG